MKTESLTFIMEHVHVLDYILELKYLDKKIHQGKCRTNEIY